MASAQAAADPSVAPAEADTLSQALLTLAVSQKGARRSPSATSNGTLSLALLNDDSEVALGSEVNMTNLFN